MPLVSSRNCIICGSISAEAKRRSSQVTWKVSVELLGLEVDGGRRRPARGPRPTSRRRWICSGGHEPSGWARAQLNQCHSSHSLPVPVVVDPVVAEVEDPGRASRRARSASARSRHIDVLDAAPSPSAEQREGRPVEPNGRRAAKPQRPWPRRRPGSGSSALGCSAGLVVTRPLARAMTTAPSPTQDDDGRPSRLSRRWLGGGGGGARAADRVPASRRVGRRSGAGEGRRCGSPRTADPARTAGSRARPRRAARRARRARAGRRSGRPASGRPNRNPWARSTPRVNSTAACSSVSTPSAMVTMPRSWARLVTWRMMAWSSWLMASSCTKSRSMRTRSRRMSRMARQRGHARCRSCRARASRPTSLSRRSAVQVDEPL